MKYQPSSQPRLCFTRSALFTALASILVGFGAASSALAADTDVDASTDATAKFSSLAKYNALMSVEQPQADITLDTLRLKKIDTAAQNLEKNPEQSSVSEALKSLQQNQQVMTPAEIERKLAAVARQNAQGSTKDDDNDNNGGDSSRNQDSDFDNPVATLDSNQSPIGLDRDLDAAALPSPDNTVSSDSVSDSQSQVQDSQVQDSQPDSLNSNSAPMQAQQQEDSVAATDKTDVEAEADETTTTTDISAAKAQMSPDLPPIDSDDSDDIIDSTENNEIAQQAQSEPIEATEELDPDDYLPDYQAATDPDIFSENIEQASEPKPEARVGLVKRLYNRLFNGGVAALPSVETTVYLQQAPADDINAQPKLIKADKDVQPIDNIKAALDDTSVQSVVDFTAALPRLRQTALDAARAVGYYDVSLRLRQPTADTIEVIIEQLGEPVIVDSSIVDIRGEGREQAEFQALEKDLPPLEGDVFNHRVYKNSKAALEGLSSTYGYFDEYWLNKSVDIILPDNTADVSLVYDTGERYDFDDVVFFTYDEETGTLTRDPDKLPVETSLLKQLVDVKAGDPFYRPAITKFSNNLSATRYFNTVNVETVLPPDERSARGTLAFDSTSDTDTDTSTDIDGNALLEDEVNAASTADGIDNADNINTNDTNIDSDNADNADMNSVDTIDANATTDGSNAEDIAPIEFTVDEETSGKLQAIKQKADRLSRLPKDRVLDEQDPEEVDSILGKISASISNVAKKIFPDDKRLISDEDFVPPTLEGRITPEQVQDSKKIPLYVYVSSERPRDAQVGLGYGTDTGARATGRIDHNLINRKGYQAGAEVEVSRIKKNATVYGTRPWKHPLNDKLEARLTYEEEVIDQGKGNFDLSTKTLESSLARNIRRESGWDSSTFLRYRLDELETGVDETELEDLPVEFTSSKPKQKALLLGYGVSKTNVDNAINPTRGYRQYYGIEAGSENLLSDTDMAIVHAGVSGIYSFGKDNKHQALGSFNTGYIWANDFFDVPYKLRFFAGGDQSIRGYDYESLSPIDKGYLTGGQVLAVGSAEYNYEFIPGFRGAVFTDVGNAYDKDFNTETKVGVGVGIRWASPVGVVRVDVAAGVTEDSIPVKLHFFIGSPL